MGNIVRKVIALIREEAIGAVKPSGSMPVMSLASFISNAPSRVETASRQAPTQGLLTVHSRTPSQSRSESRNASAQPSDAEDDEESEKALLMQALSEIQLELEGVHEGVAKNAQSHIHNESADISICLR